MYWLNGVASQLSLASALRGNTEPKPQDADKHFRQPLDIVSVEASPHASLFVSCTTTAIYLWSVKVTPSTIFPSSTFSFLMEWILQPTVVLSFVERSEKHINEFGANRHIMWKPDATAIVVLVYQAALCTWNRHWKHTQPFALDHQKLFAALCYSQLWAAILWI